MRIKDVLLKRFAKGAAHTLILQQCVSCKYLDKSFNRLFLLLCYKNEKTHKLCLLLSHNICKCIQGEIVIWRC